jgi:dihydrodipicolinate synthase/N-acetylneuraminate lyase
MSLIPATPATPATAETLRQVLATVVVVPVTPLQADGHPDWNAYAALTRRLIDGGITVITPTGEELRAADASADNVSVVKEALAQLGLCRADVRPPSRLLPDPVKQDISAILTGWGLV